MFLNFQEQDDKVIAVTLRVCVVTLWVVVPVADNDDDDVFWLNASSDDDETAGFLREFNAVTNFVWR